MANPIGINWHSTIGTMVEPLEAGLTLPSMVAGNIVWIGSASTNLGTIVVGYNPNLFVPVPGTRSNTEGWPIAPGQTLPFLTGEGESVGTGIYIVANTAAQDFFVIGYAPNQGVSTTVTITILVNEDGVTSLVLEDGTMIALEP